MFHFQQLLQKKPDYWVALARLVEVMRRTGLLLVYGYNQKAFFVFKQKFYKKLKILEFSEKCQNLLFFITFENNLSTVNP